MSCSRVNLKVWYCATEPYFHISRPHRSPQHMLVTLYEAEKPPDLTQMLTSLFRFTLQGFNEPFQFQNEEIPTGESFNVIVGQHKGIDRKACRLIRKLHLKVPHVNWSSQAPPSFYTCQWATKYHRDPRDLHDLRTHRPTTSKPFTNIHHGRQRPLYALRLPCPPLL